MPNFFSKTEENNDNEVPPLRGLSFLDRFLVVWIFLAMAIGIILGALVPDASSNLEKGKFVGVSLPIGMFVINSPHHEQRRILKYSMMLLQSISYLVRLSCRIFT